MIEDTNSTPLPKPNVKYTNTPGTTSEASLRGLISNPVYAGVPPYPRLISDEAWVKGALELIEEEGAEQFLVNLLYMLRNSIVDALPDEAIPDDYDGPWPDDDEYESDEDGWFEDDDSPPAWSNPLEGFIYCSHDDLPMILLDDEFVCVSEYLKSHINNSPVSDLVMEPTLSLVFQNGHTLPLLCPDCGESLHISDQNEMLDDINGMTIVDVDWDPDIEELYLIFGNSSDDPDTEDLPDIAVHLNSIRGLTCPRKTMFMNGTLPPDLL